MRKKGKQTATPARFVSPSIVGSVGPSIGWRTPTAYIILVHWSLEVNYEYEYEKARFERNGALQEIVEQCDVSLSRLSAVS